MSLKNKTFTPSLVLEEEVFQVIGAGSYRESKPDGRKRPVK